MLNIKRVESEQEIEGIALLQQQNLRKNLSAEEAQTQGFLTAEYSLSYLKRLNTSSPSIIAKDGNEIVGYALVATKEVSKEHDLLADLDQTIEKLYYQGMALKDSSYVIVGQLCVAKKYRGQGLVHKMYQAFKSELKHKYNYCLTDVASDNPRSLKAHLNSGFEVLDQLNYGGISWNIVIWDWREE